MYNQMVVQVLSDEEVDRIFQAMADATRRDIVRRVMVTEQSVSRLARDYDMSFAAVQKHVAVLERAGLVSKERRGREQLVHPEPDRLRQAARLLDAYDDLWRSRIARMDQILSEDRKEEHHDRIEQ
jgi:DNA-binding transcriptional ArsR family regulator